MMIINRKPKLTLAIYLLILIVICLVLFGFGAIKNFLSFGQWHDWEELLTTISLIWPANSADLIVEKVFEDGTTQPINEIIKNSQFELFNQDWDYHGQVQFINDNDESYAQLGSLPSSNLIGENCIIQELMSTDVSTWVKVEYESNIEETLFGFDQLLLVVMINDWPVFFEPLQTQSDLERQSFLFEIPQSEKEDRELKICAGNWGDREQATWVKVYQVSSQLALLKSTDSLRIRAFNREINVGYLNAGVLATLAGSNQLQLSAGQLSDWGQVTIMADEDFLQMDYFQFQFQSSPVQGEVKSCVDDSQELLVFIEQSEPQLNYPNYMSWEVGCQDQETNYWFEADQFFDKATYPDHYLPVELVVTECARSNQMCQLFVDQDKFVSQCGSSPLFVVRECLPSGWCSSPISLNPSECNLDSLEQIQL